MQQTHKRRPGGGGAVSPLAGRHHTDSTLGAMGEAALQLAQLRWHALPLAPGSKRALTRWGLGVAPGDPDFAERFEGLLAEKERALAAKGRRLFNREPAANLDLFRASADERLIHHWWRRWPEAGIGVACGPSGLLVLDIDRHGAVDGAQTLRQHLAAHGPLPPTVAQQTGGGGWQLFFALPAGLDLRCNAGRLGPGLDIRAAGGMVVVPPSPHPSGRRYQWLPERAPWALPLAEPPAWLLALLAPPPAPPAARQQPRPELPGNLSRYAERALRAELATVQTASKGTRNDRLNRSAFALGQLAAAGLLDHAATLRLLAGAALAAGLPEREVARTLKSGWLHGQAQPRAVPR